MSFDATGEWLDGGGDVRCRGPGGRRESRLQRVSLPLGVCLDPDGKDCNPVQSDRSGARWSCSQPYPSFEQLVTADDLGSPGQRLAWMTDAIGQNRLSGTSTVRERGPTGEEVDDHVVNATQGDRDKSGQHERMPKSRELGMHDKAGRQTTT